MPLIVESAGACLRGQHDVLILHERMEFAWSPCHLPLEFEPAGLHDIIVDTQLARPSEEVWIVVVALKGLHIVAFPLHPVGTAGKSAAGDEQLIPRKHQLACHLTVVRVDKEAVGVFLKRHHPARLARIGGKDIAQPIVDEIGVHQLGFQKLRGSFLIVFRGHDFQFAGIQSTGKTKLAIGALAEFAGAFGTALPVAHSSSNSCACMPTADMQNINNSIYLDVLIMADLIIY